MSEERRHVCLGFSDERYPEGTHICYLYNNDDEQRRIVSLFARHALLEGERFDYAADVEHHAGLPGAMSKLALDAASRGVDGKVHMATAHDVYFPDGKFEPDAMLSRLREKYAECIAAGYPGARFAGEMCWALRAVPGADRIIECESRINDLVKEAPMTIMCQYDLRRFDGATMFEVMSVHPVIIVGGHILRNPFYRQAHHEYAS